jgi:hypothetical protein
MHLYLAFLMFLQTFPLLHYHMPYKFPKKTPYVASYVPYTPAECIPTDHMTMCGGIKVEIVNPLYKKIKAKIKCSVNGEEEVTVDVYPRTSNTVEIELSNTVDTCWLDSYKVSK